LVFFFNHFYHRGFEPSLGIAPAVVAFAGVFHCGVLHIFMGRNNRGFLPSAGINAAFDYQSDPVEHFKKLWSGWWTGTDFIQHPDLNACRRLNNFYDNLCHMAQF